MSAKAQSLLLYVIAFVVLALVITNITVFMKNRTLAQENAAQQQFVQATVPLDGLNKEIIKALAELSIKNQDDQLRALLASNGITVNVNQASGPAAATGKK